MHTDNTSLKPLQIGELTAEKPIIQGGMGVGVSRSSLAGAVAAEGGIGIISTAQIGYDEEGFERDQAGCNRIAISKHIRRAKEIAGGRGLVASQLPFAALSRYTPSFCQYSAHVRDAAQYTYSVSVVPSAAVTDITGATCVTARTPADSAPAIFFQSFFCIRTSYFIFPSGFTETRNFFFETKAEQFVFPSVSLYSKFCILQDYYSPFTVCTQKFTVSLI